MQGAKYAKSKVAVEVFGLLIPVDLENPNACVNKGLDCPLKADTNYTFNTVFDLKPTYPVYSKVSYSTSRKRSPLVLLFLLLLL